MRLSRSKLPLILIIWLLGPIISACEEIPPLEEELESTTPSIQTIPPGTLTAVSETAAPSQTPEPDPMGIEWEDLDGLELEFWYIWDLDEPGMGMNQIVDRFNQENEWGITVVPHDQGLVLDPLAAVESNFEEEIFPQIMVGESSLITEWYQSGLILDLNPFLKDPVVGLGEAERRNYYQGIFSEFILEDLARPGMPFSQSIQVIYYNKSWAEELEFTSIPLTAEDLWEQSCRSVEVTEPAGLVFSPQAANILSFIYAYRGDPMISIGGDYHFTSRQIKQFAGDWRELSLEGCGQLISNYPNPMAIEGEYELFNQRNALVIMGSSLMQGHIQIEPVQVDRWDDWLMLPFMGPDGAKAVASEVQSVVIFDSTPTTELASWLFLKYLTSPEVQAEWSQYSGYYPTRKDSLQFLEGFSEDDPVWASGLPLLAYSRSAPLHPSWQMVKLALEDAFEEIIANPDIDPWVQLEALDQLAEELLKKSGD